MSKLSQTIECKAIFIIAEGWIKVKIVLSSYTNLQFIFSSIISNNFPIIYSNLTEWLIGNNWSKHVSLLFQPYSATIIDYLNSLSPVFLGPLKNLSIRVDNIFDWAKNGNLLIVLLIWNNSYLFRIISKEIFKSIVYFFLIVSTFINGD